MISTSLLPAIFSVLLLTGADQGQVNHAIQRGVNYLKSIQQADGSWTHTQSTGSTALVALTLLECDTPIDDPAIRKAASYLRLSSVNLGHTYSLALCILFFDRLGEADDENLIRTLAKRLVAGQNAYGGWSYTCPVIGAVEDDTNTERPRRSALDNQGAERPRPGFAPRQGPPANPMDMDLRPNVAAPFGTGDNSRSCRR
jgi:squalene cyclase